MGYFKDDNTLKGRLIDPCDLSALKMFSKEHAEVGRCEGGLLIGRNKVQKRQRSRSAHEDPVSLSAAFHCEHELIFFRLHDAAYSPSCQFRI